MVVFKSLSGSSRVKTFSISFLCGLLLFLGLIQRMVNNNDEIKLSHYPTTTFSNIEKEYRMKFNLMMLDDGLEEIGEECTLDYINGNKLQQDHPCVIRLIRLNYMRPPSPRDVPYNLTKIIPGDRNESDTEALRVLKNKKNGFFVECGAFDGYFLSNSLDMEVNHNWTGLLIEASPLNYQNLMTRNRKSWTSNVCLSLKPYPTKVAFTNADQHQGPLFRIIEKDKSGNNLYDHNTDVSFGITKMETIEIQCFPFYSLLLALNRTTVDFFSLDIEGHEKRVLETVPWQRVDIKTMRIETDHIPPEKRRATGADALREFLEGEPGYIKLKVLPQKDAFYIKNYMIR